MFSKKKDSNKSTFVRLTRVYGNGKKQPIYIARDTIESFRPRNKLTNQRCALVTKTGRYYNVAEKFSDVQQLLT